MTITQDPANLRLMGARALAVQAQPYLATALYAMKPVRETRIPTLGVDEYWRMYWNPDFIMTCKVEEVAWAWLHEVGHLLRDHRGRFDALGEPLHRHPLFNKAGDAAINHDLKDVPGIVPVKIKAIYPETIPGGMAGMTAEQFYRLLCDTPAADNLDPQKVDLVLVPRGLVRGKTKGKMITGRTRARFLENSDITITVTDSEGTSHPVDEVKAHDGRTLSFVVNADLAADRYTVEVTSAGRSAETTMPVVEPSIKMRPDHIASGWTAPYNLTVEGKYTEFSPTATAVLTHAETGAVVETTPAVYVSGSYLTFDITGDAEDGLYRVTVVDGSNTYETALPIGLPFLDLIPSQLQEGHGTPYPIAAVSDDFTFDATTTLTFAKVEGDTIQIAPAGYVSPLNVRTDTSADFNVLTSLEPGMYFVQANTGDTTAVAPLTVHPPQPSMDEGEGDGEGEGEGEGEGSGEGSGEGDSDSDGEGSGKGGSGGGKGGKEGKEGGDPLADFDDCGSGVAGGQREWDRGADTSDGSVDRGRGDLVREQTAREIRDHHKARGDVPGGWGRWAESILKPQVDWRKELRSVVRRTVATVAGVRDYTYTRPSRRSSAVPNVVMPALRAPRPPQAIAIVDTSGSVSDKMLGQALGDIQELIKQVSQGGSGNLRFIACDAKASEMQSVRALNQIDLSGGGGTDMRVGIEQAAKATPRADIIITFTDGETPWPEAPPTANPRAKYVAVLLAGEPTYSQVPDWMHKIQVNEAYLTAAAAGR